MNDQDKSKRQLIELAELRQQSERRLFTLISNLPGMAYRCRNDPQWTMDFISDGCVSLTGYTSQAFMGNREIAYADIIHPEDREPVWNEVQTAIAERRHFRLEYRIRTASGEEKWVWEQGIAIYSGSGQVEALEGMMTDITERKGAEERLERRVEDRTAELNTANEELKREIEERRRADEALRASEENLRSFLNTTEDFLLVVDLDGIILWANETVLNRLDYREEELIGRSVIFVHPEHRGQEAKQVLASIIAGSTTSCLIPLVTKYGRLIPVETRGVKGRWDGQDVLFGVSKDISELQASEERFAKAFHSNPSPMVLSMSNNSFIEVNQAFLRTFGYERDEVIGKTTADLDIFPDPQRQMDALTALYESGRLRDFALDVRTKDGQIRHGLFSGEIIQLQDQEIMLTVMYDVTERERARELLLRSHEELRSIYGGMQDGLVVADIDTYRFVRCNTAMLRMLGYSEEELLLRSVADIHPADQVPDVLQKFHELVTGREKVAVDVPVLRKDGSVFFADITHNEFTYKERRCSAGFFRDVTERKLAVETLRREHRTLKHLLHSSDHERQLIAYEIHDGLAQQLAGALMQFQAFAHLTDKNPKDAAKAYDAGLTMLQQGHFEARRLIAGVRPPILDEAGIAEAISHLVHEQAREKGPQIEYRSRVAFDRLDPTLENSIYRITQEALVNACKHSQSEKVRVSLVQQGDHVRITVRDWGVGFNSKTTPKNRYGLEGIRQRARLLGGKFSIRSKPGHGTEILVELPVVTREEAE